MATHDHKIDKRVQRILEVLRRKYGAEHSKAKIEAYRYNSASIRIRIIDPDFAGKDLVERDNGVAPILEELPEEIQSEITVLLLITPQERKRSPMSLEFDDPLPSSL